MNTVMSLNQYEWMLLYGDELAEAIKDGGMMGEKADAMLTEVQRLEAAGPIRQQARRLLKLKLELRGLGHLVEL